MFEFSLVFTPHQFETNFDFMTRVVIIFQCDVLVLFTCDFIVLIGSSTI